MKSIAIMQPTFLPWIGYFALIDRVDEFVFLDEVQFDKRSWQQRNKIKTPNGVKWVTIPVLTKGRSSQSINDVKILYEGKGNPFDKILRTIEINYKKAPYYQNYLVSLSNIFLSKPGYISDLNQKIIKWVCKELSISTPIIRSSDLAVTGNKDVMLVNICVSRKATSYISPPGSKVYLESSVAFAEKDVRVSYHTYKHPEYRQLYNNFEPFMCILDLLFNEGPDSTKILQKGNL